jgi:hypothetical protein
MARQMSRHSEDMAEGGRRRSRPYQLPSSKMDPALMGTFEQLGCLSLLIFADS